MMTKSQKKPNSAVRKNDPAAPGVTATSEIQTGKTVEQLIYDLKNGDNEMVRSAAAGALGHLKSEKAVSALIQALKDRHVYVRHGAAWALGEIKSEKAVAPLKQALNDDDEVTRGKAAEALGKIQGR